MNIAIVVGNLGVEPELRYTKSGTAVANFTLATTNKYNGEEKTDWHKIVVWGDQAENVAKYLSKGQKAGVQGRIQYVTYEDKEGVKQYRTEIVADRVQFLSSKKDSEEDPF